MNEDRIRAPETVLAAEEAFPAELVPNLPAEKTPLSPQDRSWLLRQMDRWRQLGLMSDAQARNILGLYEEHWERRPHAEHRHFRLMAIAAFSSVLPSSSSLASTGKTCRGR
ncbi:MAG: hypothetical protein U0744_20640 [Gemmataceae bacterium]